MKAGIGISRSKDFSTALQEAYRTALQRLAALKPDLVFVAYTYDHALDTDLFCSILKRQLRDVPHFGCSTWSAWSGEDAFDAETGLVVLALKDLPFEPKFLKVHSLKEKVDLWAAELGRSLESLGAATTENTEESLFMIADSIHFQAGKGFQRLRQSHPGLQAFGFGTSFGIPQSTVLLNGEIFSNSMVALWMKGFSPWLGLLQNILPEAKEIHINRMSENLVIEIDEKPAFYRLCEHLMVEDDLPMMPPDEFRKHMGNLYIVEKLKDPAPQLKAFGEAFRVVSLLGSEMTTGMVAIGDSLDFDRAHFLGQKKAKYLEEHARVVLQKLKDQVDKPSLIMSFCSTTHSRDQERQLSDLQLIQEYFPNTLILGVGSNGEFMDDANQYSSLLAVFP